MFWQLDVYLYLYSPTFIALSTTYVHTLHRLRRSFSVISLTEFYTTYLLLWEDHNDMSFKIKSFQTELILNYTEMIYIQHPHDPVIVYFSFFVIEQSFYKFMNESRKLNVAQSPYIMGRAVARSENLVGARITVVGIICPPD